MESTDPELRGRLLGAKLRGLVGDHLGRAIDTEPTGLPSGAGLVVDGAAWILVDGEADRALGPALAWAARRDATEVHLVAERSTGLLARRAAMFSHPVSVWYPEGRTLLSAVAEEIAPHPEASDEHLEFADLIEQGGADVNVEHGVVTGEVRGLEVCRVVDEATTGRLVELGDVDLAAIVAEPGVRLEVGVGANDREAFQIVHGGVPKVDALRGVVSSVRSHRTTDAPQHPLNRMAPERFVRWQVVEEPRRLGLDTAITLPPPVPRPSMKDLAPAVALGGDSTGQHLLVFTTGVDLDVVPFALDARAALSRWRPDARVDSIRIVGRTDDLVPITRDLAALAATPITFAPLETSA